MIEGLPNWIDATFILAFLATITFFYYSNGKPKVLTIVLILWSVLHSILAVSGFYQDFESIPPRFALILLPVMLAILVGVLPRQQEWIMKNRDTRISTFLHTIRLLVELVLFGLFTIRWFPN